MNLNAADILRGEARQEALLDLCERKQRCLLTTPYLALESRFIERREQELRIKTQLGPDSARHTLGRQPFKIRFSWGLTMYAGQTRLLGYEQDEKGRYLRVEVPETLAPDEFRKALRLERPGRSSGAISSREGDILRVSLENVSEFGAAFFCQDPVPEIGFQAGRTLSLSIALERGPSLEAEAVVVHADGQNLGVRFLGDRELAHLKAWMEPRLREQVRLWENRAEIRAQAIQAVQPKREPSGALLLSQDEALMEALQGALQELLPLRQSPPTVARFKEAMEQPPLLLVVECAQGSLEERHRLRNLLETKAPMCPVLVLGRGHGERSRLLAEELKATLHMEWNPAQGLFFRRLVQGLLRRHWGEANP